jgi:RNA polymerase sigma-70 factor (ECF subfamily)
VSKSHVNAGDDVELVARARDGDHAAFEQLVRRHEQAVHRAALSALGSRADADDVAQETFLLAYQRLKSFRGEAAFKTWVLTITWNQAMNHRRRSGRWWRRFVSVESEDEPLFESLHFASTAGTPEQLAAHGELRDAIREAIRALPRTLRDTLLLAQSGEYTYDEIGAMVKAKTGTIKWRVSEARRLVRKQLDARGHI